MTVCARRVLGGVHRVFHRLIANFPREVHVFQLELSFFYTAAFSISHFSQMSLITSFPLRDLFYAIFSLFVFKLNTFPSLSYLR
jgi:hypothetical protein